MYTKIQITGNIEVVTGMHIGGSSAFAAIGAVDSPVIRDVRTNEPMIPGSSVKGKMRTLLAKEYNNKPVEKPDDDCERIVRLFGSAKKDAIKRSRIIISDMFLSNKKQLNDYGLQSATEVKFENTIKRLSAVANPRQIERVVRGAIFDIDFVYEVEDESKVVEDFETLAMGMKLLQYDYLGGNGSRGYGKVKFNNLAAECVIGDISDEIVDSCNKLLEGI
ncbi:MAG: type III-A CRISPR-associated RAMP protein Csm3 [Lachnospiraceae bacterium]|nr:type III-A CRISPR-associated RAMP protein Csm3 [Lachnospiraceae bacterium]